MTPYILIVVSLTSWNSKDTYNQHATTVAMQEFSSVNASRSAATEIKRLNGDHSPIRLSCMPKEVK